ncbi:MAG TPA: hypothetical protein VGQ88_03300 [Burkholderiales bacterium]|nr:hypothetical protein [Burkholderiales bacterium]
MLGTGGGDFLRLTEVSKISPQIKKLHRKGREGREGKTKANHKYAHAFERFDSMIIPLQAKIQ